ncbi:response regulator transcription factor [Lysobacter sp. KIS68-7]|uniref:response regulator transcription factor n=1 Tax=Lysobacter sp. KIS68-7 TaxID=2904252 RepID=UPI001E2BDA31|nr:response regulator transcription factor [Lysobacter sp. KIS68-7]UHQ19557.1 response regulator transcription factor [Lysobacter sp. KIS68-7]
MSPSSPDGLKVLLVEDQADIAANIWDFLERRGHEVDHCADGASGLERARNGDFDVIVLDLGLPRLDGLDLCKTLRDAGLGVPVLMLTARDTLDDKLRGYAHGADDYMVKPFAMRELEARIRVIHRGIAGPSRKAATDAPLTYDATTMTATREGKRVPLTRLQGRLLDLLLAEAPKIVAHERLLRAAWGAEAGDMAALHTQMYELRALLDKPFDTPLIRSVRGVGYRILPP